MKDEATSQTAARAKLRKVADNPGPCPACGGTGLGLTCTSCQGTGRQSERQIVINEGANALILGSMPL